MILPEPSIYIFDIRLDEPVTTLTDLLVAGVSLYALFQLLKRPAQNKIHHYLRFFFLGMALSTALGGLIGHGFFYLFSPPWQLPGWMASMIAIAFLEQASIDQSSGLLRPGLSKFLTWLIIIELTAFTVLTVMTIDFIFVVIHTAFGLLIIVAPLQLFLRIHNNNPGSTWFLAAISITAISTPFFINQWIIHQWFNHFCICHTLIAISMWFFYKGALKIISS
ncbi:MAG: hypothetical protein AMS27_17765 [Bacteroides sp. SM23_62_1]|nr:MAG: hypothetical protein AMS27_17765 [Bacteroides sp. SM23_62_1]